LSGLITEKDHEGETARFWNQLFIFEAYLSLSFGIVKHTLTFPIFSENTISLSDFYHPVLGKPIKNKLTSDSNLILFTGPNMSGKSTLLKAISLCVYLGHIGMGVPASKAVFPFFDTILIRISHNDDIINGYSHFMTEVIDLKKVVLEAVQERKCFAVFDELFIGTNIEDAVDISSATLNGLTKYKNSLFLISTHLHQLKETAVVRTKQASTWFLDCELDEENPLFTYKLKEGWSEVKVGRLLFNKEGLTDLFR
jgi:DNA mismatch repair protein MutS